MKIYFAADHAGYELKNELLAYVHGELGYEVEDCGAHQLDTTDDYPLFIGSAARAVAMDPENTRGIVLGKTGQGEAMAANRYMGVRASVYYGGPHDVVSLSREHNNANMLSLGAGFLSTNDAKAAVAAWLSTPFSNDERHVRRIRQIEQY